MPIVPGSAPGARVIECPCSLPHQSLSGLDPMDTGCQLPAPCGLVLPGFAASALSDLAAGDPSPATEDYW